MGLYETVLTGRTRTLRLAGDISIPYYRADDDSPFFNPAALDKAVSSSARIFCGIYQIDIKVDAGHSNRLVPSDGLPGSYRLRVTAPPPLNVAYDQSVELWPSFPGGTSYGGTVAGTYEIEIDVAEQMQVRDYVFPDLPTWNLNDGPAAYQVFQEVPRGSSNVRVNVTLGGLSFSQTFSRPDTDVIAEYEALLESGVNSREVPGTHTSRVTAESTNLWRNRTNSVIRTGSIPYNYGASPSDTVVQVPFEQDVSTIGGARASHTFDGGYVQDVTQSFSMLSTGVALTQFGAIRSIIHGKVNTFEEDYPHTLNFFLPQSPSGPQTLAVPPAGSTLGIDRINGVFTGPESEVPASPVYGAGTQTGYSKTEFPYDDDVAPNTSFEARLDESSLIPSTDETGDSRVQGRGKVFGTLTIGHDEQEVLENFNGPSGWTPLNSILSGSTSLLIETDTLSGGAQRIYSPTISTEAWRYWNLTFRSIGEDNVNFRIRINGRKSWYLQTGLNGEDKIAEIDTNYPGRTESGALEQQDSRWPVKNATDNRPVNEAKNWGVNYIEKIEILDLAPGLTIEIDELKAITDNQPRLQFASAHHNAKVMWFNNAPAASQSRKRHLLGLVDGRSGLEVHDMQGQPTLQYIDISAYATEVNGIPGWSAALTGFGDAYYDSSLPAQFVAGEGAIWNSSGRTIYTDKQMAGSTLAVPCQFLWDRLSVYPGIGDVFEGTGHDDDLAVINIRFLKFMRGAGHGFILDGNSRPAVGQTATIYTTADALNRGSGVSDSGGFFTTLTPYAYTNRTYDFKVGSRLLGQAIIYSRKRQRVGGKFEDAKGGRISYDVSAALRHFRAYFNTEGEIITGYSDNRIDWTDQDSGLTGESLCLNVEPAGKAPRLYLWIGSEGGSIIRHISDNEGATWGMPTTIGTGRLPAAVIGRDGHRYVYWIDEDPAVVKGRVYDASDQLLEDTFTAIDAVDEDGLAVDESVESQGKHRIVLLVNQGGTLKSFKSFNGIDFV